MPGSTVAKGESRAAPNQAIAPGRSCPKSLQWTNEAVDEEDLFALGFIVVAERRKRVRACRRSCAAPSTPLAFRRDRTD